MVWVPVWATLVVMRFVIELLDGTFSLLPLRYQPDNFFGFHIPGLGIIFAIALVVMTGLVATNIFGKKLVSLWEHLLAKIPVVRSVYSGVKQVLETLFSNNSKAFRKVLLVEFPRQGTWTLAFQTAESVTEEVGAVCNTADEPMLTVYVPTTPNPTGGYLIMVRKADTKEVAMSVDEALKYIISLGVVQTKHSS